MKAAVVTAFDQPPSYADHPDPVARRASEQVVEVLAAGLHPRVRSQANGSHYTSDDELPLVPGIDGVGRSPDGVLRYFVLPDTRLGSLAERTLIDVRRSIVLPDDADPVAVAAAMNPTMSSWLALRHRAAFEPGQNVLILGATGNAGRLAIDVARHLGAGRIVAAARDAAALSRLSVDTVLLDDSDVLAKAGADTDVVLDYLWGDPTAAALRAIVPARTDDTRLLTWIQIGSVADPTSPVPSAALRATNLRLLGSGQGSVPTATILAALPEIATTISAGTFAIATRTVPLEAVAEAWTTPSGGERLVVMPNPA